MEFNKPSRPAVEYSVENNITTQGRHTVEPRFNDLLAGEWSGKFPPASDGTAYYRVDAAPPLVATTQDGDRLAGHERRRASSNAGNLGGTAVRFSLDEFV